MSSEQQLESYIVPKFLHEQFNASEIDHFRRVFAAFDADGTGTIDDEELTKVIKQLEPGASDGKVQLMVSQFLEADNKDGSGTIDFGKFFLTKIPVCR